MNPIALTIFFPAYNDAESIPGLVDRAAEVAQQHKISFEILVVNDGSPDNISEIVEAMQQSRPYLRLITHTVNQGYGGALRSGFANAKGELIFYTDGDAQYDVKDLAKLLPLMTDQIDVVNGFKIRRADGLHRLIIGIAYNLLARIFFRIPISDVDCDFRLMRASAIRKISLESKSGVICSEMIYKLARSGARFTEVAVTHLPREFGTSQFFTIKRVGKTLIDFFSLWFKLVVLRGPVITPPSDSLPTTRFN